MFSIGDTVEIQETFGTRTRRRVLKVVKVNEKSGVGADVLKPGVLIPFSNERVTTVVPRRTR